MKKTTIIAFIKNNLAFISVFTAIFIIYILFSYNFSPIPLLGEEFANIRINIKGQEVKVKADNIELKPVVNFPFTEYKVFAIENHRLKKLELEGDEAIISIGDRIFFSNNPNGFINLKYINNGKFINDKGALKSFQIRFLSMLYNSNIFMLVFFFAFFIFIQKKTKNYMIFYILALSLILRLADLSQSAWSDELYTVFFAGNINLPFITVFQDPGNPPLFFILIKLFQIFFKTNYALLRLVPILFSLGSIYLIYFIVKDKSGLAPALFCSLISGINIYFIVSAQELRCYSAVYFFSLLIIIYLFKIIENPLNKNFILYGIFASILINLHYFGFIILFVNFIYGLFFIKNKNKFILANVFPVLTFLPYLLLTGIKKGLINKDFNSSILRESISFYIHTFIKFSSGYLSSLIILFLGIFSIYKKNKFYSYNLFLILFVFCFCFLFGFIRPIAKDYYFIAILPNFIILYSYIFSFQKVKYAILIPFLFSYFSFKEYIPRKRDIKINYENMVRYYRNDKTKDKILISSNIKLIKNAFDLKEDELIGLEFHNYSTQELFNEVEKAPKKAVYLRVSSEIAYEFLKLASKKYKTSFIRIGHDDIITKIEKY